MGVALAPGPRPSVSSTRRPGLVASKHRASQESVPESIATACARIPSEVRACVRECSVLVAVSTCCLRAWRRGAQSRATCVLNPRHTCACTCRHQPPRPTATAPGRVHACDMSGESEYICMQPLARMRRALGCGVRMRPGDETVRFLAIFLKLGGFTCRFLIGKVFFPLDFLILDRNRRQAR